MISQNAPNCSENDHHVHHHANHTRTASSQTNCIGSVVSSGPSRRIINNNDICGVRCRSLLSYQQLQIVNYAGIMGESSCSDAGAFGGRCSPHPNEMFFQHHGKLSIQPISGYDDSTNCCLPPPSPAPNSDRYIMGVTSSQNGKICDTLSSFNCPDMHTTYGSYDGGGNSCLNNSEKPLQGNAQQQQLIALPHHQHQHIHYSAQSSSSPSLTSPQASNGNCVSKLAQKYVSNMQQCSISPNTRLRLSDRFREVHPHKSLVLSSASSIGNQIAYSTVPITALTQSQTSNATRYVSSAHFLTQNTPMMTNDTYTYLSSTVHTPVKRYVPTPPPSNEIYTDISLQPPTPTLQPQIYKCANNDGIASEDSEHGSVQHVNTLPYRFHMKCCSNDITNSTVIQTTSTNTFTHDLKRRPLSIIDYYTTSPRTRPAYGNNNHTHNIHSAHSNAAKYVCTSYDSSNCMANNMGSTKCSATIVLHDQQMQTTSHATTMSKVHTISSAKNPSALSGGTGGSSVITPRSSTASPLAVGGINCGSMYVVSGGRLAASGRANNSNVISDYFHRTPNIEYTNVPTTVMSNSGRMCTSVSQIEGFGGSSGGVNGNGGKINSVASATTTCLHCNSVRRTTGVHQTTQTTGPISPIPLQQVMEIDGVRGVGLGSCGSFLQSALDQVPLTPSTSESHNSPLAPSMRVAQNSCILFSSKMDGGTRSAGVDQLQLQHPVDNLYVTQRTQQHPKNVITQCTMTEHIGVVGSGQVCNQQQQQHLQQTVGSNRQLLQSSSSQPHRQSMSQPQQEQSPIQQLPIQQQQQQQIQSFSRKKRFSQYIRKEISRFFGVDASTESEEFAVWQGRQRRLALRRFGALKPDVDLQVEVVNRKSDEVNNQVNCYGGPTGVGTNQQYHQYHHPPSERPDILPAPNMENDDSAIEYSARRYHFLYADFKIDDHVERKASVATMIMSSLTFLVHTLNRRQSRGCRQWSRSFAPAHVKYNNNIENSGDIYEGLSTLQEDEVFFDSAGTDQASPSSTSNNGNTVVSGILQQNNALVPGSGVGGSSTISSNIGLKMIEHQKQIYVGERVHGWRTSSMIGGVNGTLANTCEQVTTTALLQQAPTYNSGIGEGQQARSASSAYQTKKPALTSHIGAPTSSLPNVQSFNGARGNRISAQLLDGVLENSRRPIQRKVKLFSVNDLDDRSDHRPFFTYWINTVQILVLFLSLICYGIGPIGIGVEQKTGQVLVTSLSLQTVQHTEQRNVWIGPRNNDLVHMGAKFATCMRNDFRIMDVLQKTRRQERETACCIRNDDSGCVQSSQADCSVRGLFPTNSISTWKKWSPGESGPGGRISGSVCGLDPKYCDAPASIAPYEWPDDITKWPICRKTNSFSQRFRYKDHTAEHMVCEVIGHPCCTGVYGECRITTREYCDFVKGYFHEEASLCSQISCLNNVCGMLPFISVEVPDQFYRLFTSLCLHAGILHLAITIACQHVFLADLERLIGPIRTAIVYIGSGLAGNLTSAVLVPYKPEVGPLAALSGVIASLVALLILIHWKQLREPHIALFKLICIAALLFGIGTLPWQLNFAGLLAGIFCGVFLTITLVPFVSITKYGRKAKINLIWSCVIFHWVIYSVLLMIFYVFPMDLAALNLGEVLSTNFNSNSGGSSNVANSVSFGVGIGGIGLGSSQFPLVSDVSASISNERGRSINGDVKSNRFPLMQHPQQYFYHHRSSEIITSEAHFPKGPLQTQRKVGPAAAFYHYAYHINHINHRNNYQMNGKFKYNRSNKSNTSFTNYYYKDDFKYYTNSSSSESQRSYKRSGDELMDDNMKISGNDFSNTANGNKKEDIGPEAVASKDNSPLTSYNINNNHRAENINIQEESDNDIDNVDMDAVERPQHLSNKKFNQPPSIGRHLPSLQTINMSFTRDSGRNNSDWNSSSRSSSFKIQQMQQQQQHTQILHATNERPKQRVILNKLHGNDRRRPSIKSTTIKPLANVSEKMAKNNPNNNYIVDSAYKSDYVANNVFFTPTEVANNVNVNYYFAMTTEVTKEKQQQHQVLFK